LLISTLLVSTVAAVLILLILDLRRERRGLQAYVDSLNLPAGPPLHRALALAACLGNRHQARTDPIYLSPLLRSLGGTATDLIAEGGCCSGLSRLYMVALDTLDIRANQITVHHRKGHAQHCLVEVHLPEGPACVDPFYGIHYADADGRTLGLEDLQAGVRVHCRPIEGAISPGYPGDDYYAFDYRLTRTANWTRSWPRRTVYSILRVCAGSRVDRMRVPQFLEWPQTLLAVLLLGTAVAGSGAALVSRTVLAW
jgi:hypothetical protein